MSKIPVAKKTRYPDLDNNLRRHIGVLRERRSYLLGRVRPAPDDPASSYHEAEADALEWALDVIDEVYGAMV
jgi:hypothetical protein